MMGFEQKTLLPPNNLSPDPNMQDLATPKLLQNFQTNQPGSGHETKYQNLYEPEMQYLVTICTILTQY